MPVDEPADGYPSVQEHLDHVGADEVLHVLDALLEQAGLVPDVQSLEVAQRVVGAQRGHCATEQDGGEPIEGL